MREKSIAGPASQGQARKGECAMKKILGVILAVLLLAPTMAMARGGGHSGGYGGGSHAGRWHGGGYGGGWHGGSYAGGHYNVTSSNAVTMREHTFISPASRWCSVACRKAWTTDSARGGA